MKSIFNTYYNFSKAFWNTVSTEWNAIKKDKAIISTFLSLTFLVLVVYTYIYSKEIIDKVTVAVVNQDASKTSRDYIAMLNSTEGLIVDDSFTDLEDAKTAYYQNNVKGIVILPKDFGKDLRRNRQPTITVFADASNMIFYKKVLQEVTVVTGYFNAGIAIKKELSKGTSVLKAKENYTPIKTVSTSLFNTSSGYATYIVPILTALIIQLVLLMGIGIINGSIQEKNKLIETFPSLSKPGGTIPVLLGKSFVYTLIFAFIIPIQIGIVYYLFSIPIRASLWSIYLFAFPYLLSVVYLGMAISSFFKRREDAIVFIILTSIPALMLSGLSYPMESFSVFYQYLAKTVPSTAGINGFVKLTQMEASFADILPEWNHLWVLTFVYFIIASIVLKIQSKNELKQ